jgi:hypothetical protein
MGKQSVFEVDGGIVVGFWGAKELPD